MKYSFKIGSIWGIPIELHFTFLLLILAVFLLSLPTQQFYIFVLTMLLFLFVVFHELAHSVVARHYGIQVRKIILYPIGGVSEIEEITDNPTQEWRMAIAGPAVSLIIGFVLLVISFVISPNLIPSISTVTAVTGQFLFDLAIINILLGVFNLVPAFPMDGGRVFRALLAKRKTFSDATRYAVTLGKILGVAMVIVGFVFNFLLIIVGLFVYIGASEEGEETIISTKLAGIRVKDVMQSEIGRVEPQQTIKEALEVMFNNRYHDVLVEEEGVLEGIVTWNELVKVKPEERETLQIMQMPIAKISIQEDASILEANKIIITQNIDLIPVVQKDNPTKLVGVITSQAIANAYEQAKNR